MQSPAFVTDVTAHIYPDSAGYHYCKLLSPARIMEWIYVDGLRRNDRAADHPFRPDIKGEKEVEEEVVPNKPLLLRGGAGTGLQEQ